MKFHAEIVTRLDFGEWLTRNGRLGIAAELGVLRGDHARQFLSRWNGRLFHAVDDYRPTATYPRNRQNDKRIASQALAQFAERVRFNYQSTASWLASRKAGTIDWLYLDAEHDYDSVRNEIDLGWPAVKAGGILAGHDFGHLWPGVVAASTEFAHRNELELYLTRESNEPWSWFVFKGVEV